jgi:hypothetical protein
MNTKDVKKLIMKTRNIQGWFSMEAGLLIAALNECQSNHEIKGDIFEIGVHHGKSTVLFANLLSPSEKVNICDIFDSQEHNISSSGFGDKMKFLSNIENYTKVKVNNIHSCPSSKLDVNIIGDNYRIFHIDGGHNKTEALPDLILASKAIQEKGIIILDDPFRPEWPGVTEALLEFLNEYKEFKPIVVGFNKIIICRKKVSELYESFLDDIETRETFELNYPFSYKKLPFLDSELRIFYMLSFINPTSLKSKLLKKIIYSGLYRRYKKVSATV